MQLAVLGVGGAGCRLADRLTAAEPDDRPYLASVAAFDTDVESLERLDIDQANRHAFGSTAGSSGDALAVREAAEANALELQQAALDAVPSEAAGVLVTVGVGGATGSGAAPILVDTLREAIDSPVYALTVLPASGEEGIERNARAGLLGLEATVDSQLLFDNDELNAPTERLPDEDAEKGYADANETIAEWTGALFSTGEASVEGGVAEQVVDASELIATFGEGGYATLGYNSQQVRQKQSFFGKLLSSESEPDSIESYSTIETATRRALYRHRSLAGDLTESVRSLLVTTGPPAWLNREAIADARGTVAEETGGSAVRGGDVPIEDGTHLTVLVLCAGMNRPERVIALVTE
ncbi:Tubulin/FtsZ GTPase [halophilic archaeon DL31]|nr:Tubulin/FtsZ GTPase [halophilic archaeon DL31]